MPHEANRHNQGAAAEAVVLTILCTVCVRSQMVTIGKQLLKRTKNQGEAAEMDSVGEQQLKWM